MITKGNVMIKTNSNSKYITKLSVKLLGTHLNNKCTIRSMNVTVFMYNL